MYPGSGLSVGSTQRSIPGIRPGLLPLSLTWGNQTSKEIDADLGFIWGPVIWRLSNPEETLKEDQKYKEKREGKGRGESECQLHVE